MLMCCRISHQRSFKVVITQGHLIKKKVLTSYIHESMENGCRRVAGDEIGLQRSLKVTTQEGKGTIQL